ncbi:hypothetical protein [Falsiroseomonas tokyonensis]|uniref:Uncharacterized protein n=1 Tax=Falsiroseomonas tokyonensis TaxID=430521 RepID=A0ABV7BXM2_9PROT|nr:hypothetical protein [Falsiroseomonas tokyonensis]MBU8540186.1 hypothetical protein [Falsiroseomonas tokyonensis]
MTIEGNDQGSALSGDDARPTAVEQQAPASQPDASSPAPSTSQDPDAIELAAALAAVEAESKGGDQAQQQPPAAPAPTATSAPAPQEPPKASPPPVPYSRFAEVNRQLREQQERAAYLEGALEATRKGNPAPAGRPEQQPPAQAAPVDAASQTAALKAALLAKAAEFDSGAITMTEFEEARVATWEQIQALQRAEPTPAPQRAALMDEIIEETHLTELQKQFPEAAALTEQQASLLAGMAEQMAAANGGVFPGSNKRMTGHPTRDTIILRESVAHLARANAAVLGLKAPPAAAPAGNRQQQATTQPPTLSPAAKARQAKMDMAANLPPDPSGMGTAAEGGFSAAQLERMSDEQIAALPAQTRAAILASTR